MTSTTYTSAGIRAYFQSKRSGLEAQLAARIVEFIAATETSLDCAIYDLRHPEILAALAQLAQRRHVRLRIAFDGGGERNGGLGGDPKPDGTAQALDNAGLGQHATAIHEHGRHLMHDKFMVRDGRDVWVGSANMTVGGLELQDNNCLDITSPALAATYTATFEALIGPDHQHAEARSSATAASAASAPLTVGDARMTPYFAPQAGEGIEDALIAAIRHARRIRIMAFLIGDPGILDALLPLASNHAFDIRGVYDPHGMQDVTRYSDHHGHQAHAGRTGKGAHAAQSDARFWFLHDPRFIAAPTHGFAPGREQDFMHNKVIIIDDRLVFTGSYNFSENAEANDETMLAIESPALAAAYTSYFDVLYATYTSEVAREPVAVGAAVAASAGAAAHLAGHAPGHAAAHGASHDDEVVARLREEHARSEHAAHPARPTHAPHPAKAANGHRAARPHSKRQASRRPSQLDGAIRLTLILLALTALALVAFTALALAGVLF